MKRKLTTVFAMDAVGYSRLMERDEEKTHDRLKSVRAAIIDPLFSRHGGRVVKLMGDGTLAEFGSVVSAVQCAIDIQESIAKENNSSDDVLDIAFRIGIHLGDVLIEGDDIYGDGVNVASRLESLAPAGGIVLSKQVHDHLGNRVKLAFTPLGAQSVKNIHRPIEAFSVDVPHLATPKATATPDIIRFNGFELDTKLYELRSNGQSVAIEPQVFDLLLYLAKNAHQTMTKDDVVSAIWNDRIVSDASLSSLIKSARKAVGDDGEMQHTIKTIRGRGFRFVAEFDDDDKADATSPVPSELDALVSLQGGVAIKPSVAVLPFANPTNDSSEDYLSDGFAEDITTALSKHRWLNVVARNSAFAFRHAKEGIKKVGEALAADYIVSGSVRKAGSRARVTVQVVDAETEISVWSERFDRDIVDIFALQDEITELVAGRIEAELGITERKKAERQPRKNRGAWDLYQLASAEFYKFTPASNQASQELLQQALAIDPKFAAAHSRLAYAIILSMVYFDAAPDQATLDLALASAKRAIELDDQDANGFFTIGRVHLARREYQDAIEALSHALELNPCLAVTYCGLGDSLAYEGRLDEAIEQFETAIRLSPHDPFRWAFYSYRSLAHLFRGEYDQAVHWARRAVQTPNAQYWASAHLVAALGHAGDASQAKAALDQLYGIKPEFSVDFARRHLFYLKRDDQMAKYLEGLSKAGVA